MKIYEAVKLLTIEELTPIERHTVITDMGVEEAEESLFFRFENEVWATTDFVNISDKMLDMELDWKGWDGWLRESRESVLLMKLADDGTKAVVARTGWK